MIRAGKRLLLSGILAVFAAAPVFSQEEDRQVALIRFQGTDAQAVADFGDVVFAGIGELPGYQPVMIDMDNLPPDVPEGGFPPYVSPGLSMTGGRPYAVTGELSQDEATSQWTLRLYLWDLTDPDRQRLVFSDMTQAPDRDFLEMVIGGTLEWIFSWLVEDTTIVDAGESTTTEISGLPAAPPPAYILYAGLRAGWNVQMFNPLWSFDNWPGASFENISAAAQVSAFLPHKYELPLYIGLQVDLTAMQDFENGIFTLMPGLAAKLAYRSGTAYFSVIGGAYIIPLAGGSYSNRGWYIDPLVFGGPGEDLLAGITAGIGMGSKIGPGSVIVDMRWSNDMFAVKKLDYFNRHMISISIGYELGFFPMTQRATPIPQK